jgi:hypothetical protein
MPEESPETDQPVAEPEALDIPPIEPEVDAEENGLLKLDQAVSRIPDDLRKQLEEKLRAEFREVRRWKPGKS